MDLYCLCRVIHACRVSDKYIKFTFAIYIEGTLESIVERTFNIESGATMCLFMQNYGRNHMIFCVPPIY